MDEGLVHGTLIGASLAYIGLLFAIAYLGDRWAERNRHWPRPMVHIVYALSMAIYCTSWTFFGSVGRAAASGHDFLAIYVGPSLVLVLGYPLMHRLVRVCRQHSITSIADFIGARYGKSQWLAAVATIITLLGVIPYIALQLKAVTISYQLLTGAIDPAGQSPPPWRDTALAVAMLMACFTILFGVRHVHSSEHHRGLMLAVAFEGVVKLVAFLAVGGFVTYGLFDGFEDLWAQARASGDPLLGRLVEPHVVTLDWLAMTVVAACAFLCLPRQFHVAVVENNDPGNLKQALWLFPLYLLAINLFVLPVAVAGLLTFGKGGALADLYVLSLPLHANKPWLTLFTFIGGLSAGTSMVIIETVALSTMASNEVVIPLLLRLGLVRVKDGRDLGGLVIAVRRGAVVAVLLTAYLFYRAIGAGYPLVTIGLMSFAAVAQFAPALVFGLYWRRASRIGALCGILTGFVIWAYTLMLPTLAESTPAVAEILASGLWGIDWLRPHALLFLRGLDPVAHSVIWSLGCNVLALVLGSLLTRPTVAELASAEAFCGRSGGVEPSALDGWGSRTSIADLEDLLARFVGTGRAQEAMAPFSVDPLVPAGVRALRVAERLLAGAIGAASARIVLATSLQGGHLSRREAIAMLDDATAAILHNRDLLRRTVDSVQQGICMFDAELRLAIWNRRFIDLLGLPDGMARVGLPLDDLLRFNAKRGEYGPGSITEHVSERLRDFVRPEPYAIERMRPDGTVLDIEGTPLPDGGFVLTYTDITDRRRAEWALAEVNQSLERRVQDRTKALAQAKVDAERANQSKTRFLAAASHDLLQPLNAARLFVGALAERPLETASKGLVDNVEASLRAVESLLGALLDISKLDAGVVAPRRSDFRVDTLLSALVMELTPMARDKGLRLRLVHSDLAVFTDERMLRRILQNFLVNALRYTQRGGVLVGCRRVAGAVRVEVVDTGPGIPEDQREAIFHEFHRLNPERGADGGLGLGLAIVERMARMLGHPINLASRVGFGTRFGVTLPLARAQIPAAAVSTESTMPRDPLAHRRVLCIDNETQILAALRSLLGGWGLVVSAGRDLAEAVADLPADGGLPTVLLVDYHLSDGATGLEALRALRERFGPLPAILMTADRTDAVLEAARAEGCTILLKPVKPAALRAVLSRLVGAGGRQEAAE
jgi:Na+/proline symporter/signal transduction histidine kinase